MKRIVCSPSSPPPLWPCDPCGFGTQAGGITVAFLLDSCTSLMIWGFSVFWFCFFSRVWKIYSAERL